MTTFAELHNRYSDLPGKKALIIACGVSAQRLRVPLSTVNIGIHDCWERVNQDASCLLDYLMVYDKKSKFLPGRRDTMRATPAHRVILRDRPSAKAWLEIFPEERVVWVPHRQGWRTEAPTPQCMFYGKTSIDPALHFAEYLGLRDIGIIGMDFSGHLWERNIPFLDEKFGEHAEAMAARGCRVINLSENSLINVFPKMCIRKWLDDDWSGSDPRLSAGGDER